MELQGGGGAVSFPLHLSIIQKETVTRCGFQNTKDREVIKLVAVNKPVNPTEAFYSPSHAYQTPGSSNNSTLG